MIIEYTRYRIPLDRSAEFESAYAEAAIHMKNSPYCLRYELTRCTEEPERYILRIEWGSVEGHLQGFRKDPSFREFFRHVQPFFKQIEEMQHYELTRVVS